MALHRRPEEEEKRRGAWLAGDRWRPLSRRIVDRVLMLLPERVQRQSLGVFLIEVLIAVCLIAFLGIFMSTWGSGQEAEGSDPTTVAQPSSLAPEPTTPVSTAPASSSLVAGPGVPVDTEVAPAPGMEPSLAPPDGPAPDQPPFGVDAEAMRSELRTHGVDLPDSRLQDLVLMADKYIAEGDMDLDAWDPRIMADVKAMWPELDLGHRIDVTRCAAEYIERVEARNAGLRQPPDEDDHGVEVDGHGAAPRVTTVAPGGEAPGGN